MGGPKVREVMTDRPRCITPETPISEAARLMKSDDVGSLPILEGDRLAGIVTDRDIRLNMPSPATSLSVWEINYLLARMTVESCMTKVVITVSPDRDASDAARILLDHKIGALPVLDAGAVVGIVTETDMVRAFAARRGFDAMVSPTVSH